MIRTKPCPSCGGPLDTWYETKPDGDVEPRASCDNHRCTYGY